MKKNRQSIREEQISEPTRKKEEFRDVTTIAKTVL